MFLEGDEVLEYQGIFGKPLVVLPIPPPTPEELARRKRQDEMRHLRMFIYQNTARAAGLEGRGFYLEAQDALEDVRLDRQRLAQLEYEEAKDRRDYAGT